MAEERPGCAFAPGQQGVNHTRLYKWKRLRTHSLCHFQEEGDGDTKIKGASKVEVKCVWWETHCFCMRAEPSLF